METDFINNENIPKNHKEVLEYAQMGEIIHSSRTNSLVLKLPTLWIMDSKKRLRYWEIYIGILDKSGSGIDVNSEYIDRKKLNSNWQGIFWTKSGLEFTNNPIISEYKEIESGKNTRGKNFTTPFTQAILEAISEYKKKIKSGAIQDPELFKNLSENPKIIDLIKTTFRGKYPWRVFPMLLHDANKNENLERHINFPCYVQPKLDGTLLIIIYHPDLPNGPDCYSRGLETIEGQEHILNELGLVLKKYPGIYFVGELWKPGFGLQDISGSSRRLLDSKIKEDRIKLEYWIHDCFIIGEKQGFKFRWEMLSEIINNEDFKFVKLSRTYLIQDKKELMIKYHSFIREGLEGAVVRNLDSLYQYGLNSDIRSYETLKLKPRPDGEWPIVGFTEGRGKEKDQVIWICCINDEGLIQSGIDSKNLPDLEHRITFNITPNMTVEKRKIIFEKLKKPGFFEKYVYGKLLTISYSILSKDYLPQQPKGLRFKDPELENLFLE